MTLERPNDLDAFWLPFTPNKSFKAQPRMLARAEGMYFHDESGRALLDASSGLWCVNAGHGRKEIADAIASQAHTLDFAPTFQFAHPQAFTLARALAHLAPEDLNHVFFVNSGSEAADAALKLARAYFQKLGQPKRTRLIGREKAYHGVTFGGISVGGLPNNRNPYGPLLPGTEDHLPLPYERATMGFTRGEPEGGARYADALEAFVAQHGADTIAAVIVEPFSGSAGVYAPPKEYLKRLRTLCDKHGILLIFDEVITGFGRVGAAFAAERYGVVPDIITFAKGVTNGAVPMGGIIASDKIHAAFKAGPDHAIEFFHGHTYSAHPLACAAALAALELYREEGLFERGATMARVLDDAVHTLKGAPRVFDVRNCGLAAGIDIEPDPNGPGRRGYDAMRACFFEENMVIRIAGDTIALAPALIVSESEIGRMVESVRAVLARIN
jgi:beta-alanine--pyruvate transaminase